MISFGLIPAIGDGETGPDEALQQMDSGVGDLELCSAQRPDGVRQDRCHQSDEECGDVDLEDLKA